MWGWIILLFSAVFAAPNAVTSNDQSGPLNASESRNPERALSYVFGWLNPFNWMAFFPNGAREARQIVGRSTYLHPVELAEFYGYAAENHTVTTEDGYILGLHRLPSGLRRKSLDAEETADKPPTRPVVLLHHAYLVTSREYLTLGPQKALAFVLSDAGYDVWLCNARGNTYSRQHERLSPDSKEFWDFSYDEHGYYDLPAVINYVLEVTGQPKLHYLGHSMGTLAFFIMSSERPDMLNKVISFTALGPVMTTGSARSQPLQLLLRTAYHGMSTMRSLGFHELLPHYTVFTRLGETMCRQGITQRFCKFFLDSLSGTSHLINNNIFTEMLAHTPSGTSTWTLEHFAQNARNGFRRFDYGTARNMEKYKTKEPPFYNLTALHVPTQIYYGKNDRMADPSESLKLRDILVHVVICEAVEDDLFTHLDFIWADNAHEILYPKIVRGMKRLERYCPVNAPNLREDKYDC